MINKKRIFPLLFLPLAFENVAVHADNTIETAIKAWTKGLVTESVGYVVGEYTSLDKFSIKLAQATAGTTFDTLLALGEQGLTLTDSQMDALSNGTTYSCLVYYDGQDLSHGTTSSYLDNPENICTASISFNGNTAVFICKDLVISMVPDWNGDGVFWTGKESGNSISFRCEDSTGYIFRAYCELGECYAFPNGYWGYKNSAIYVNKPLNFVPPMSYVMETTNRPIPNTLYGVEIETPNYAQYDSFSSLNSDLKQKYIDSLGQDVVDEYWTDYGDEETGGGSASYPLSMPSIIEVPQMPSDYPVMLDVPEKLKSGLMFWYDLFVLFAETLHFQTLVMAVCAVYLVFVILDRR